MSSPYLPVRHRPRTPRGWTPETWRLITTAVGFATGAIAMLIVVGPAGVGLSGRGSVGEITSITAGAGGVVIFAVWYLWAGGIATNRWRRRLHPLRRLVDLLGLSLIHASIALLGLSAIFWVSAQAFRELQLDRFAAAGVTGAGVAVASYLISGSALRLTTRSLSELVALFVVCGALSSMLTASDPLWWHAHLSQLGAYSDASGMTFNVTLVLAGLVITTLSDFITHDLSNWARGVGVSRWRVDLFRIVFIVIGLQLSTLAFLPVDRFFVLHNVIAYTMIGIFGMLVAGIPFLYPTLSRSFSLVCFATVGLLVLGLIMFFGFHYLNLTAFELIAIAGVFAWLVLFISTVDAAAAQLISRSGDLVRFRAQPRPLAAAARR